MELYKKDVLALIQSIGKLDNSKLYDLKVEEHNEKRSLDANAYYWHLVNVLANHLRISKDFVHKKMLKDYGQSALVTFSTDVVVENFFRYYDEIKRDGKWVAYKVYQGSSTYNSKEMAILIDGIIQELEQQGLEYEKIDISTSNK